MVKQSFTVFIQQVNVLIVSMFGIHAILCRTSNMELPDDHKRLQSGEQEFQKLRSRAKQSNCWDEAVSRLRDGCKQLSDVEQSRLAIAFSNCHFEKSGLPVYACNEDNSIEECTADMAKSVLAFNTYTEFYTHTSDICFYLQSKLWQQKTEMTINKLSSTSEEVARQLEASITNQRHVLEGQKSSLANQGEILKNEAYLKNALQTSAESAKEAFLDMKKATAQQKAALMETFDSLFKGVDRITKLQSMLLGEFMTLHSLGFYLVSILASYIITSAPRTAAARLWLFVALSGHIVIERLIVRWNLTDKASQETGTTTELLHSYLWAFRKIFVFEGFLILVYFATKYCDYAHVNYNMLRDIQAELRKFKEKRVDVGRSLTDNINKSFSLQQSKRHTKYPAIDYPDTEYPLHVIDESCISEEDPYTDDSYVTSGDSGSESEDPTFVIDNSDLVDSFRTGCLGVEKKVCAYNLRPRPRSCLNRRNDVGNMPPDPKSFSDLVFHLTRSSVMYSMAERQSRAGGNTTFSDDEDSAL